MKELAKRYLPKPMQSFGKSSAVNVSLFMAFAYDFRRYGKYSSSKHATRHKANLAAMITERYHSIEKGLSLPSPRPGFGARALSGLLEYTELYRIQYGDDSLIETVAGVLAEYVEFNNSAGLAFGEYPYAEQIHAFLDSVSHVNEDAGTLTVDRNAILDSVKFVGRDFFYSRFSVRQFSDTPVAIADIEFAVLAAQKSPAVCNRQFSKVYVYTNKEKIRSLLLVQGGANGFAEGVSGLAVITTSLRSYWNDSQRHQAWVDGGLFSMSFLLGLHARGLGAVALNWSKNPRTDRRVRHHVPMSQDEVVIMFVAFGALPERLKVASSVRRSVDEVMVFNPDEA